MTKYHINKKGIPSICNAKDGNCPLGSENLHFNNLQDAQIYADNENKKQYGLTPELGLTPGLNPTEDNMNDLIIKRNELAKSIEHLKGVNKIRAKKELKRIEYSIQGRDYDEEMRLQSETKKALIAEQEKRDLESKANSEKLANKDTLELPESIKQYVTKGQWSRSKILAYRGEQKTGNKTNTGLAIYGQGRYTTTDKSYAKKFGTVRNAELEELPANPLRLKTTEGFQLMEQIVAEEHNVNYKDLYNNMDVNDMIMKMGYDGLTIGTGKDMIIVKYSSE